jgi:hypothetical protein
VRARETAPHSAEPRAVRAPLLRAVALALAGASPPLRHAQQQSRARPRAPRGARDTAALRRTLDSLAAGHRGVLGYVVHNLDTGERLARATTRPSRRRA